MILPADVLRGKILIVDDREANILLLERMLRGAGYVSITSTMDSSKVCELHLLNRYDLILLDLQMPGMDGFQVMEHLKELEAGGYLPVLVVTAQPDHKLRALEAGAKDFVSKPFDLAEVLLRVHNMLEVRLLHLETRRLYDRVVAEQKVSERLLAKPVPGPARVGGEAPPALPEGGLPGLVTESYAELTVLFADVAELASFSEGAGAEVLAGALRDFPARLDSAGGDTARARSEVIGDAYLAAAELPGPVAEHTVSAVHLALDLAEAVARFNQHGRFKLEVKLGMVTGAAVTGVIRKRRAQRAS